MFNVLEALVVRGHGEGAWDGVLARAGATGAYTSLGNYPDEELAQLLAGAAALRGETGSGLRWFGRSALPILAQRYPVFFTPHTSTTSFLWTLNDIIHTEVRKLYPGAGVPDFELESSADGGLVLGYRSARKMCELAEGLIEGAADHFGERVVIDHATCMLRGGDLCVLACRFTKDHGRA